MYSTTPTDTDWIMRTLYRFRKAVLMTTGPDSLERKEILGLVNTAITVVAQLPCRVKDDERDNYEIPDYPLPVSYIVDIKSFVCEMWNFYKHQRKDEQKLPPIDALATIMDMLYDYYIVR